MTKVWCARCGALAVVPRRSGAIWHTCEACGYPQKVPDSRPDEPARPISAPSSTQDTYALDEPPTARPSRPDITEVRPAGPAPNSRRGAWAGFLKASTSEPSRLQVLGVGLVLLSVADLLMTYLLLRTSHRFYESNPVAHWFFERWNMAGMVFFKFGLIGFVIATGEYVERRRPRWGQAVLLIGCLAAAYAFSTGLRLYLGHGEPAQIQAD